MDKRLFEVEIVTRASVFVLAKSREDAEAIATEEGSDALDFADVEADSVREITNPDMVMDSEWDESILTDPDDGGEYDEDDAPTVGEWFDQREEETRRAKEEGPHKPAPGQMALGFADAAPEATRS